MIEGRSVDVGPRCSGSMNEVHSPTAVSVHFSINIAFAKHFFRSFAVARRKGPWVRLRMIDDRANAAPSHTHPAKLGTSMLSLMGHGLDQIDERTAHLLHVHTKSEKREFGTGRTDRVETKWRDCYRTSVNCLVCAYVIPISGSSH